MADFQIQRELDAGENLLWSGAPDPARAATRSIAPAIIGVFVTGFALFWMAGAHFVTSSVPANFGPPGAKLFPLFGLIFVFAGLALIASPFLGFAKATTTIYAVTDRRLLIVAGSDVRSFLPRDIQSVERRGDTTGDIIFARRLRSRDHDGHSHNYEEEIGFFGIQNPREVERLIRAHLIS